MREGRAGQIRMAACAGLLALFGALAPAVWAEEGVLARERIFAALAGRPEGLSATRGIAAEAAGPTAPQPFATAALPAIRFEHDSARLTQEAERQLRELAAALQMAPLDGARFAIQGHTNSLGAAAYNRQLSLRRAAAARGRLVDAGIAAGRLTELGLGEDMPLPGVSGDDPGNRRVEVVHLGALRPSASDADPPDPGRALLVGIDDYAEVTDLMGAPVNDVRAMRDYLRTQLGYPEAGIRTLLNGEATRAGILAAIEDWLVQGRGRAFLYFSGHGHQQPDGADGDEPDGFDETLVPVDVAVEGGVAKGMIADDEIAALLARMSGRRVDVVIDACHSGTLTRSAGAAADWRFVKSPRLPDGSSLRLAGAARGLDMAAEKSLSFVESTDPDLTMWTAVQADQKALVDSEAGPPYASVFTRLLIAGAQEGRADADADGAVTAAELQTYLQDQSAAYCERNAALCFSGLTPQLTIAGGVVGAPAFNGPAPAPSTRSLAQASPLASLAKDILVNPSASRLGGGAGESGAAKGVRLRLAPGPELQLGDAIEIVVESDRDGALVLLDIDAAGQLTQVFPNAHSLGGGVSRLIRRDEALALPGSSGGFRLRARPPEGRGLLVAVVADDAAGLASFAGRHKDLTAVPRPDAFLTELAGHLRRWSGQDWSYGELDYQIGGE